jgi:hypothetical protein
VLLPEQLQRHALPAQLAMDRPAPIEWSGGDVSLRMGAVPARARAERLGRIAEPDARAPDQ